MAAGTVKDFRADRGWGFARPDDGSEDVMLHVRELCDGQDPDWLQQGARISYEVRRTPRGLRAANIRVLSMREPDSGGECDVLAEGEFREAVHSLLEDSMLSFKSALVALARRHGWVE